MKPRPFPRENVRRLVRSSRFVILCGLLAVAGRGIAATSAPERLGARFVEAVNATDTTLVETVAREVYAPAALEEIGLPRIVGQFEGLHENSAPLEYHHSEMLEFPKPDGTTYVLHVYARKKGEVMWSDFQIYLDPVELHRTQRLALIAEVAEPVALPNGSIEDRAELRYFPRLDMTLILFNNQDNGAYDDLRCNALELISGVR